MNRRISAYWVLRLGAALCFVGHGAFGFITKAAWLPYFAVAGIPERWAWSLMPWIGAVDVVAGMAVLFAPSRLPLWYMTTWALWTAVLRPLAGESVFETLERAGNYGVPFALLVLTGAGLSRRNWFQSLTGPSDDGQVDRRFALVLRWTTVALLVGHGALGALVESATLRGHHAAIGLPAESTVILGLIELGLAAWVAVRPGGAVLLVVAGWKLATESLFVVAGSPIWEFVERAGSYAAPVALALILARRQPKSAG